MKAFDFYTVVIQIPQCYTNIKSYIFFREISSYAQIKKLLRESLKPQRAEIKQTEDVLKKLLASGVTAHELFYEKIEVWIETEKMYEVLYELTV